jgi:hypothetical protein
LTINADNTVIVVDRDWDTLTDDGDPIDFIDIGPTPIRGSTLANTSSGISTLRLLACLLLAERDRRRDSSPELGDRSERIRVDNDVLTWTCDCIGDDGVTTGWTLFLVECIAGDGPLIERIPELAKLGNRSERVRVDNDVLSWTCNRIGDDGVTFFISLINRQLGMKGTFFSNLP